MNRLKSLISIAGFVGLISACETNSPEPAMVNLLSKKWKMIALVKGGTHALVSIPVGAKKGFELDGAIEDVFSTLPACDRDNLLILNSNGKYNIDEGPSKCYADDPQIIETGHWSLRDRMKLKKTSLGGFSKIYTMIELSASRLKMSYTDAATGTITMTATFIAL